MTASSTPIDHCFSTGAGSTPSQEPTHRERPDRQRSERKRPHRPRRHPSRGGFTLLEVLIATAVTLLMMLSLSQIFQMIGESMQRGRAVLELNNRLRSVTHRIRTDLNNLTSIPNPPTEAGGASGYLEIFDGSTTDFTAGNLSAALSRIGDIDDILMGTVRAGDVWFTGKVPQFVLNGAPPTVQSDYDLVTIASQYAEVAMFAQPLVSSVGNPHFDPTRRVTDPNFYQDIDGDIFAFPDGFHLQYRTLLIRPDLNLPSGVLPADIPSSLASSDAWVVAQDSQVVNLPSPLCDMAVAFSQCDLSMRRVFNPTDGLPGQMDYLAANNLQDLVSPANRFAHVQVPIPGTASTSMPLMALAQALPTHLNSASPDFRAITDPLLTAAGELVVGSGFLHPAYSLQGDRIGEDFLASDLLAFDVKVYDPSVQVITTTGPDFQPGTAGQNDDESGTTDDAAEYGWSGTDDLVLSPNDRGYAAALTALTNTQPDTVRGVVTGTGAYVDLGWARKLLAHGGTPPPSANLWSAFSGLSPGRNFTDSLYRSGKVLRIDGSLAIMQTSYDTWSSHYEGDGILQAFMNNGTSYNGVMRLDGQQSLYGSQYNDNANAVRPTWTPPFNRQFPIDAGTDGIDNPGSDLGVDDPSELETMPPFPTRLRGIQISVRMEDPRTRQIRQMSVAREFVTN